MGVTGRQILPQGKDKPRIRIFRGGNHRLKTKVATGRRVFWPKGVVETFHRAVKQAGGGGPASRAYQPRCA